MPRKPKPPMRRVRPAIETDTYTSQDLCARYGCAQITIRRKEAEEGYPHGSRFGRKLIYSKVAVHDWERKHMPWLHPEPEMSDDDKHWDRIRRRVKLEREEEGDPPPPPPPKRPAARAAR